MSFLTRLVWRESAFRPRAVSPRGAQGVAQFMPGAAAERGLADPFDPEQAIPHAAALLADHRARFGNLGLAAAAYNGGPNRLAVWLASGGAMPEETRAYVAAITGRGLDEWRGRADDPADAAERCLAVTASLRRPGASEIAEAPFAPWGVQLAGHFSRERALASFRRERGRYAHLIVEERPMIIGTRLRSRGTRPFYRVRVPAPTRLAADGLCGRIRAAGGACVVLRS